MTINQASKLGKYSLQTIEDLFAQLASGKTFTKLDLSQVYQQVRLDEPLKAYTVINTLRGLFQESAVVVTTVGALRPQFGAGRGV